MPKNTPSRAAVSAVIERFPETISPIRRWGTPISLARRYCVTPSGLRNSSSRISPGDARGTLRFGMVMLLTVVDDFHVPGSIVAPDEADPELVVDPNAPLTAAITR